MFKLLVAFEAAPLLSTLALVVLMAELFVVFLCETAAPPLLSTVMLVSSRMVVLVSF